MNVGVGLPTSIPGIGADRLLEWAQRAEAGSFSSLGVVDRLRYECFEPMTSLAAVAAATERIGLVTMVVIGPLRNDGVLAKAAATLDAMSNGRFTLGLAVGARGDDYDASGITASGRGHRLTEQLVEIRMHWERAETQRMLAQPHGPKLLVGGMSDMAFLRMARYAQGYVHGGGPPKTFARAADRARTAWSELGRTGLPALWAQGYFTLGDDATIYRGLDYMRDYYAFTGPFAERVAEGMLRTPQAVAQFVRGYKEAGCDEIVLLPAVGDLDQLDRLQDALSGA
ncbi:MAG: LLM class flavin-dependent oxidoreductase [Actinomycetota bacterium]|nr:LLM class flavin-dependent oxidoreductase [Actinomycetota bacterium]